ncbi:MAG: hypothetical protein ACI8UO_006212 [Verrucomicrobiales bacterium]|jgi:hypothetical protein
MRKRDYQNQLKVGALAKLVLLLAAICGIASAYVYVRNQHIRKSDYVRTAEREMTELRAEIQMYELRIAALVDRPALESRLLEQGSELRKIGRESLETVSAPALETTESEIAKIH